MAPPLTTPTHNAQRRASLSELARPAEQQPPVQPAGGSRAQAARSPDGPLRPRSGSTSAAGDQDAAPDRDARQATSARGGPRSALPVPQDRNAAIAQLRGLQQPGAAVAAGGQGSSSGGGGQDTVAVPQDRDAAMAQIRAMQLPPASAMPHAPVNPQPSLQPPPVHAAPGGGAGHVAAVAPLHVAPPLGALTPTDVNPFMFVDGNPFTLGKTESLHAKMRRMGATSMDDAVRMTMQSMRSVPGVNIGNAQFDRAVQGTVNALRDNGITTMRGFVKQVVGPLRRHALGLSIRQGLLAGTGFNVGAILWDAKFAEPLQNALAQHFPHLSSTQLGAATTAIIGASLYVADVATSYAAGRAHAGSYPTKPGGRNVPASLQNANPISAGKMAAKLAVGADLTYGGRELTVRGLGSIAMAREGKPPAVQANWEVGTDGPMGLAAAAGLRVFLNKTDDNAGRSGVQVPMFERGAPGSRTADGGAGVDRFLQDQQRSGMQKAGDAAVSTAKAVGSFVGHLPSGVGYAMSSLTGATSATFLVGGLTALNVAGNMTKQYMLDHGHSADAAEASRQTVRMFGLMAVYALWGGPMGAAAVAEERAPILSGPVPPLENSVKGAVGQV